MAAQLSACSSGGSKPAVDAGVDGAFPENPCGNLDRSLADKNAAELFGASSVPAFDLYLSEADWENLKVHARDEVYVPAQACFEGKAIGLVGLRFKGSYGSLYNCFDSTGKNTCRKLGMKIKFDEYVDSQVFFGLKRLSFQSNHYDDTYLHERLSYDLYRAMDVVAPRAAWAVLRVNGESQGLFGMVEQIDGRFTKDRWPTNGEANLFKERWPGATGDAWIIAGLETNTDAADIGAFKAFSAAINAASETDLRAVLGGFTDLDYFARYMAVDDAIANFDGITTYYTSGSDAGNHNFYFYEESAKNYTIIPWDLESTLSLSTGFGSVPYWQNTPADCNATYLAWGGPLSVVAPGCDRVFRALSADRTSYRAAVKRLLDGPFAEATMLSSINTLAAFILPEVTKDPHGPGTAAFQTAVASLRKDIPNLRNRLENLASGKPIVPLEIAVGAVNDFEGTDSCGITTGTTQMSNVSSTSSVTVNDTDPIGGAKTLRILFNFVDETKAWDQWMFYRIPFASPPKDLSALAGIRMKVRSDELRTLRVDVDSPKNSAANQGIEVGWDVSVDVTAKTATVSFAEASVPGWATVPGGNLTSILQSATGLTFRPLCNHVDLSSGHLPAGTTDNGWVDIDDIELF
jgi:spore coat protein H